jgi:hypothetical protein
MVFCLKLVLKELFMTLLWILIVVSAAFLLGRAVQRWWKYRGERVITCPENQRPAGITVDTSRLAAQPFANSPRLQLSSCSRWPEHAGCGQECLRQVEAAPEDCLVRNILLRWYAGKCCVSCGRPFGEIALAGVKPAVIRADKQSVEWSEIPAEQLAETLAGAAPICFACHMASTLVRTHPEVAIDRHRPVN